MKVKKTLVKIREESLLCKIKQEKEKYILRKQKHVFCSKNSKISNNYFEGCNFIGNRCHITNSRIGYGTYIHEDSKVFNTSIGRYTSIAMDFRIVEGHHPKNEFISTSPVFYSLKMSGMLSYVDKEYFNTLKYADKKKKISVVIGSDVWIGASVKIMQGVTIGDGAIIGAGAVVTKNVEPYGIYVGVPAKKIGQRFENNVIENLLRIKWWNKGEKWIINNVELFSDPKAFLASLEK